MEHLAVGGTFGSPLPPPSSGILAGPGSGPGSTNIPPGSATTPSSKTRHRLVTEPCYVNDEFNEDVPKSAVVTPKSPRTPTVGGPAVMVHTISHRFTMTFKMLTVCDLCSKQMIIGLKCKECKYKCHRDCASKVPPSCKLPPEFIDYFRQCISDGPQTPILQRSGGIGITMGSSMMSVPSPSLIRLTPIDKKKSRTQPAIHMGPGGGSTGLGFGLTSAHFDSSSTTSSCSSSTPSSPALQITAHISSTHTPPSASQHTQFRFPDVHQNDRVHSVETLLSPLSHPPLSAKSSTVNLVTSTVSGVVATENSVVSTKTQETGKLLSGGGLSGTSGSNSTSTDSERTYRVDSQDSQISDTETTGDRHWPRQNSLSLREWDIPFHELELGDSIGQGRFGTVHRGNWHGDVAIRLLNMDQVGDEKVLESFKHEV